MNGGSEAETEHESKAGHVTPPGTISRRQPIVPVIDLKGGQVVRGVAGQREQYQPVQSPLVRDAHPATVARAFVDRLGFQQTYVADLDAISGGPLSEREYQQIAASGASLLVDAGVGDVAAAEAVQTVFTNGRELDGIIVGLESLAHPYDLRVLAAHLGPELGLFSLDLKAGQLLSGASAWSGRNATDIADTAIGAGFRRLIVLDVASVGVGQGPSVTELCRALRARHPHIELISGGGVRHIHDVHALLAAGCDGVLVASALHDERITAQDVKTLKA